MPNDALPSAAATNVILRFSAVDAAALRVETDGLQKRALQLDRADHGIAVPAQLPLQRRAAKIGHHQGRHRSGDARDRSTADLELLDGRAELAHLVDEALRG